MQYTDDELREILDNDFIRNPKAFTAGRRNDDCVDAMCICHALNIYFYEDVWLEHQKLHGESDEYYRRYVQPHAERIYDWLHRKELAGFKRGKHDIMAFAIGY